MKFKGDNLWYWFDFWSRYTVSLQPSWLYRCNAVTLKRSNAAYTKRTFWKPTYAPNPSKASRIVPLSQNPEVYLEEELSWLVISCITEKVVVKVPLLRQWWISVPSKDA